MTRPTLLLPALLLVAGSVGTALAAEPPGTPPTSEARRGAVEDLLLEILDRRPPPLPSEAVPAHLEPCHARFRSLAKAGYHRNTLITTLPDPLDSPFRRELDAFLLAVLQAMSRTGYVSDLECLVWRADGAGDDPTLHRRQPGVLVFRRDPAGERTEGDVVALLVVGETPRGGVHSEAMAAALRLASDELGPGASTDRLEILGPTFSGSAKSMGSALRAWAEGLPEGETEPVEVRIRSGSATNTGLQQLFASSLRGQTTGRRVRVDFRAVPASNADLQSCVWNRLVPERLGLDTRWTPPSGAGGLPEDHPCLPDGSGQDNPRVALLVEASAYGRQFKGSGFHVVPYSPYLASLRAAHERQRREVATDDRSGSDDGGSAGADSLPLDLGLGSSGHGAFDPEATLISQDLVLTRLLQELARRRTEVVGIIATNTLDKLFLAERLSALAPDVRVITFEGDVLLAHPTSRGATGGMIVASSQPLSDPEPLSPVREEVQVRFDFDAAQGLYRALVELLEDEQAPAGRHVWFTVVGQGGFHPLERIALPPRAGEAPAPPPDSAGLRQGGGEPTAAAAFPGDGTGGRLPRGWWLMLTMVSLALGVAVLQVNRQWRCGQPLFGLVTRELVRPRTCRAQEPDPSLRTLHALVAVVPTVLATPYVLLAMPVVVQPASGSVGATLAGLYDLPGLNMLVVSLATLCLMALFAASGYLLLGLCLRTGRDLTLELRSAGPDRRIRAGSTLLPLAFAVGVTALTVHVTLYWLGRTWGDQDNGTLLVERALALGSGVSPLLPSLLLTAVPVAWIVLSLYRHRVLRELPTPAELHDDGPETGRRYRRRITQLRRAIDPGALWQGARAPWVLLLVIPLVYLALFYGLPGHWPLRSMEGKVFDLTTSILFTVALVMVVASGISLLRGWSALRKLLDWIKGMDTSLAVEGDGHDGAVSLAEAYATAFDSRSKAAEDRSTAWHRLQDSVELARDAGVTGAPLRLAERLDRTVVRRCPASALVAVARWLEERSETPAEQWAPAGEESADEAERHAREEAGAELVRSARSFFTWSTACFLRDTRTQLVHLMAFMTAGLIVLLVAVSTYPFQPQRVAVLYLGILITLGAILSATVVLQADRDRLLRSLGGGEEGRSWHQLAGRLGLYAGVPAVSLLASRFPAVRDVFTDWIEPLFKALL